MLKGFLETLRLISVKLEGGGGVPKGTALD